MVIIAYYGWETAKQWHNVFKSSRQSLTIVILQQGLFLFIIIFIWSLEITISNKLLNVWLAGFDVGLENSIAAILICRFMLQLRKFNTRVQTIPSVSISTNIGIQGRLHRFHETIIEEFGNSGLDYSLETENDVPDAEGDTAPNAGSGTELRITAEEFPWTINPVESLPGPLVIRNVV
ncbi:hypothetical protein M422DRAFT_270698 [Sphaerobolus stellatus SS14]|uniref:Uncharacterized protein n=1 Tax=Sphaerobolus stellatus (strain SS14) TaxID=990650 RepID=A0A0C9TFE9_SPHS4|nr:hypothetical protein M422DRAFT_270698 [Sphaerobolus stellatus SS14]